MDAGVTTEWRNRYQLLNDLEDVMARIHWGIEVLFELSALADQKIETGAVAWLAEQLSKQLETASALLDEARK